MSVRFYGLLDNHLLRVVELHVSRVHVERELARILEDEPDWVERYAVVAVELGGDEPHVELV
jgi:hypothetical protein